MSINIVIPKDITRIRKVIIALKAMIPYDAPMSREIHKQAIKDLRRALKEKEGENIE